MKATHEPMKRSSNDYVAFIAAEANMTVGMLSALARGRNHNEGDSRTDEAIIE